MSIEAMNYEAILAWLEAKRAALDKAIEGIKEMMGLERDGEAAVAPAQAPAAKRAEGTDRVPSDAFFRLSITDAAKKYLGMIHKPQRTPQICEALKRGGFHTQSKNFTTTVHSVLARQERAAGDIVRVKRGQWGLAEWYPNMRRKPANGKGVEEGREPEKVSA